MRSALQVLQLCTPAAGAYAVHLACTWCMLLLVCKIAMLVQLQLGVLLSNDPELCMAASCRYQGYDWRDRRNWECNNKRSPVGQGLFDNSTLSLYDLLFVKVKASLIEAGDTTAQLAVKYTAWMSGSERLAGT